MVIYIVLVGLVWLVVLSFVVFKLRNHYYNLISRTRKERLDEILDSLLDQDRKNFNEIELIKKEFKKESESSKLHLQKVGLIRFNPFDRAGGEQSFVVAFLDNQDNGIILNFIYTRDGLRVYTKKVKQGKGEEYDLSDEEKKAIDKSY
ncbi:DUF4446 family protein [Candidatus Roizmanbacteria bacterium]|nr:DUF4446 family protein [Candidatus Roizmanbacteria bacterium]